MYRTLTIIAGVVAAIAVFAISGEAVAKRNPDQHFNFTQNGVEHHTTIDHGYTYIYITCYGKSDPAKAAQDGWDGVCSSPEAGITCSFQVPHSRCSCMSDTKKAHTVKVSVSNCFDH